MLRIYRADAGRALLVTACAAAVFVSAACTRGESDTLSASTSLIVYNAGSLARPIRVAFDSFAVGRKITLEQQSTGSLESARKITELGQTPDVIALADAEIFPQLLMPKHVSWYIPFARNRMVIAYRAGLDPAYVPDSTNWWQLLDRDGVRVGRSDPARDPNGYRVLLTLRLIERQTGRAGLAQRLLDRWGDRHVRAASAELLALLQAGEVDYIWAYESVARAADIPFVHLSGKVDLSNDADSALYATARVRIAAGSPGDSITVTGAPIRFALSIPRAAQHGEMAAEFVRYLVSGDGARILSAAHLDVLAGERVVGDSADSPFAARSR